MRPSIFLKKLSRPIEAVPGGTRKQTGLPRETLLDRGPLLLDQQWAVASSLDEGRTPVHLWRGVSDLISVQYVDCKMKSKLKRVPCEQGENSEYRAAALYCSNRHDY